MGWMCSKHSAEDLEQAKHSISASNGDDDDGDDGNDNFVRKVQTVIGWPQ